MDGGGNEGEKVAEEIRRIERERLRALVAADVAAAEPLHAEDFQLVTPLGRVVSKEEYMKDIGSGAVNYLVWEADPEIRVRVHGDMAVIRYRSRLQNIVDGEKSPLHRCWHIDTYEKRDGRWQVVWSQAARIRE